MHRVNIGSSQRDPNSFDSFDEDNPLGILIAPSHWAHEPADTPGTHLQSNQIKRLKKALDYLRARGVEESAIIAISPFRAVADQLSSLAAGYPGLRAGTIHTAQGREAPIVILVLGGDPNSPAPRFGPHPLRIWLTSRPAEHSDASLQATCRRPRVTGIPSTKALEDFAQLGNARQPCTPYPENN